MLTLYVSIQKQKKRTSVVFVNTYQCSQNNKSNNNNHSLKNTLKTLKHKNNKKQGELAYQQTILTKEVC